MDIVLVGFHAWFCRTGHTSPPKLKSSNRRRTRGQLSRGFAAAINEEKERREPNEKDASTKHPDFVARDGFNLLCRKKRQGDAQNGSDQAAHSRKNQRAPAVVSPDKLFVKHDLQQCAEHVEKGNELEHHSEGQQGLE